MDWEPVQASLNNLVQILADSQVGDTQVQNRTYAQLAEFNKFEDYNNYLVFIFAKLLDPSKEVIRVNAGLQLKNNMAHMYGRLRPEWQNYIRDQVLMCLGDSTELIRTTAGQILLGIVVSRPDWLPLLVSHLINLLKDTSDLNVIDGSLSTLFMLCEDLNEKIENNHEALSALISSVLPFLRSPHESFRVYSLSCINQFIIHLPTALLAQIEPFLDSVIFLAQEDSSPSVRQRICQCFVMLVAIRSVAIMPHLGGVINFMLMATQDNDTSVALEACEFWATIAETEVCREALTPVLPNLLHVLLSRMVYSEDDILILEAEDEDSSVPDRPETIAPRFARNHARGGGDGFSDPDGGNDDNTKWNLRKCAAYSLDMLATVFRDDLLGPLIPQLNMRMGEDVAWEQRESAILGIGAIAHGCYIGLTPFLPGLIEYLVKQLRAPQALTRSITCWSLSQYSRFIVENDPNTYFNPILLALLERMLDNSKRVQEAACSAFATLEEEAQNMLVPHIEVIIHTIINAFRCYQAKNLLILYDAIGTLADCVQGVLAQPCYVDVLLPALIEKWQRTADTDRSLLALLECFCSVSMALGNLFQPYVVPVFERCLRLIEQTLFQLQTNDLVDRDFMICSIDLISALVDSMQGSAESLVSNSQLLRLLYECMQDHNMDVRQSVFALIGDIAKFCPAHIPPVMPHYVPILIKSVQPISTAASNNACWALGEITMSMKQRMAEYAEPLIHALIPVIEAPKIASSLLENSAITLGRLALVCPDVVSRALHILGGPWCHALRKVRVHREKEVAFRGLCLAVQQNPEPMWSSFTQLCEAIGSWHDKAPHSLQEQFFQLFQFFRNAVGQKRWTEFVSSMDGELRAVLQQYNL